MMSGSTSRLQIPSLKIKGTQLSRMWQQAKTNIYLTTSNTLFIQLEHGFNFDGGVALDDIKLSPGQCHYDSGMECDFNQYTMCGYDRSGDGFVVMPKYKGVDYGPVNDHTTGDDTGFFFFFHQPVKRTNAIKGQITINNLTATTFRPQCLKFFYQIDAPTTSSFYIYVMPSTQTTPQSSPVWVPPYNNLTQWTRGQTTIYSNTEHKIMMSFYLGLTAPVDSFVALDDISVSSGACEPPATCNFDQDFCAWHNSPDADANWVRFTGRTWKG